jgi:hypothetical protein
VGILDDLGAVEVLKIQSNGRAEAFHRTSDDALALLKSSIPDSTQYETAGR